MRTLSHWQWLVLSKRPMVGVRGVGPCDTPANPSFRPLNPSLILEVWLNTGTLTTLGGGKQKPIHLLDLPLGAAADVNLQKKSKGSRVSRSLDHCFLTYGLLRFGEELSGAAFSLVLLKNLLETAHPLWVLEVYSLHSRLGQLFKLSRGRGRSLGRPSHPWYGGAKMIVSSVCSRDPFLLAQWAKKRMGRMRLFAHKKFLRLLGSFLRSYVSLKPSTTTVLGFNLVTTGKISVTGNAMSRTMLTRFGKAGINNLSYRASSTFVLIKTKTGCLGLNLVFYY